MRGGVIVKIKLFDLLKIFKPRTRINLKIEFSNSCLVYEDSLSDFIKSKYYRIYYSELVRFEGLVGTFNGGFTVQISVKGELENDL